MMEMIVMAIVTKRPLEGRVAALCSHPPAICESTGGLIGVARAFKAIPGTLPLHTGIFHEDIEVRHVLL